MGDFNLICANIVTNEWSPAENKIIALVFTL
jgi:hypothetical protein